MQGLSIEKGVVDFNLLRQKQFNQGQMYTALSRVTSYDGLYLTGEFTKSAIKVNRQAEKEYERLRNSSIFNSLEQCTSNDTLTMVLRIHDHCQNMLMISPKINA